MAILENRADPHGKGFTTGVAFTETGAARLALKAPNPCLIDIAAMWANRAIRPQVSLHIRKRRLFVTEAGSGQNQLSHRRKLLTPPNLRIVARVVRCNVAWPFIDRLSEGYQGQRARS